MLLQSHTGVIRVFPAIPESWSSVSFESLRAMGAFLVSAEKKDGKIIKLRIYPEQGGRLRIASPFGKDQAVVVGKIGAITDEDDILSFDTYRGEWIDLMPKVN